jgi:hypothetical protein
MVSDRGDPPLSEASKATAIMVMPTVLISQLPPNEREIVSRFLFRCMRGLDEAHDRAWRRLWGRAQQGEILHLYEVVGRSGPFHRHHMAIEGRIFQNQELFTKIEPFRIWLKTGAAFGAYELVAGRRKFVPSSISYDECSDGEMREFHRNALDFLYTPRAQRKLWPHIPAAKRHEMLETLLRKPEGEPTP